MWDKLRRQVATELEQLGRLLETHRSLLNRSSDIDPSPVELMALAAMLHSFYNGAVPTGEFWHRDLLNAAT